MSSCSGLICWALTVHSREHCLGHQIKISQFLLHRQRCLCSQVYFIPHTAYCRFASPVSARNLTDCIADFIIMDEQILQAYQMNTNTFSDLSVCLMGLALNNVQNEKTCQGKWKMTTSFVIVLHNILLILFQFLCARYFSFDLEVNNRKYRHKKHHRL